jgi:cytidylate kinase
MKHGITIEELKKRGKKEIWTDKEVDDKLIKIGEKDMYVIDSWIAFHFIPESRKIFLEVDSRIAAERVFKKQRKDEKKRDTVKEVEKMLKSRVENTRKRYLKYYNVDYLNQGNYELVIDTSEMTIDEVVSRILEFVKE